MRTLQEVGTVVTQRDRSLFRALVVARVLDAEQMMAVGAFQSIRRTNRRLLKLVRAGLLRRWFIGTTAGGVKALYGLTTQAAVLIGETAHGLFYWKHDTVITGSQALQHQQAINDIFIRARFGRMPAGLVCNHWQGFREPLSAAIGLLPDGYFEIKHGEAVHPMFLEADLGTETSKIWRRKVELYLKLATSGEFERLFGHRRFRVLVLVPSARRLESLRKTIAHRTEKLFWLSAFDDVTHAGLWAPIWLRPVGGTRVRLIEAPTGSSWI